MDSAPSSSKLILAVAIPLIILVIAFSALATVAFIKSDKTQKATKGDTGAPGAQGPQGPPGNNGVDGVQGVQGLQGPAGKDGAQGLQGPAGKDGAQGLQGPAGKDGAQGLGGPAGPAGKDGAQGLQGPAGPAGKDGAQGPAGPAGKDGAQGLQGPAGPAGPAGNITNEIFSVYLSKDTTIPAGYNFIPVLFDVIQFGNANNWNSTSGMFTTPISGYYAVSYMLSVIGGGWGVSSIFVNGKRDFNESGLNPLTNDPTSLDGYQILKLDASSTINIEVVIENSGTVGGGLPGGSNYASYLQIMYLRPY